MLAHLFDAAILQSSRRRTEIRHLRRRLRQLRREMAAGDDRIALARELERLRCQISDRLGAVSACRSCARSRLREPVSGRHPQRTEPLPAPGWPGGSCCGGRTAALFDDLELAILACAGVRPGQLPAPRGPRRGCAFRAPDGCTLATSQRPLVCIGYLCDDLARELERRGDLASILDLIARMESVRDRFIGLSNAAR